MKRVYENGQFVDLQLHICFKTYLTLTKMIIIDSVTKALTTLRKHFETAVITFLKIFSIMEIHLLDVNRTWLMLCSKLL